MQTHFIRNKKTPKLLTAFFFIAVFAVLGAHLVFKSSAAAPGDINNDGTVNVFDLSLLLSSYGQNRTTCITNTAYTCDLNNDGTINIYDLSILLSHYGQ